jgi:protoporphyrinogen oxidase
VELNKNKVGGMFLVDGEKKKRVIILGAGVTGLSAGIRLLKSNCDVCILEKSDHSGGLAKTIVRGEYRLDIGPHHLFSQNEKILQEILDLFDKEELVSFKRDAKLLFNDRFLNYPLTAKNVLLQMGLKHAIFGAISYLWSATGLYPELYENSEEVSFQDWARANFGGYLYGIFFKPYTEQFWGVPCEEMSVDCVPQVTKMSFLTTLKMVFLRKFSKETLSVAERETSLTLFYPIKGIGAIVEKLKKSFLSKGGMIKLNCDVSSLIRDGDSFVINYEHEGEAKKDKAIHIISSIPISSLVRIIRPAAPETVKQSADNLEYLSTIVLYVVIHDRDVLDCAYLYMVNRPYNRISNTNRFHNELCPEGENMLALEMTCHFNGETWKSTDEELYARCIRHLESDKIITRGEVKQFFTIRIKSAYPFYRLGYRKKIATVFDYFKSLPNITLAGRTGAFKYQDIDQCMEDTDNLVKKLKSDGAI